MPLPDICDQVSPQIYFLFFMLCTFKMKAIPTLHSFHLFIAWEMLCIKLWSVSDLTSEFVFSWSKAKEYN